MAVMTMGRRNREPMSKVDTAWLRMERATNLMMISGVMMFESQLDIDRFKRMLRERFLAYRRFQQKAVDTPAGAYWETDADFDLDWHVRLTALPGKGGARSCSAWFHILPRRRSMLPSRAGSSISSRSTTAAAR